MSTQPYDSTEDTLNHIARVTYLLGTITANIYRRALNHDASKLKSPEKEIFDKVTPKLKALTYGSDEYRVSLAEMGDALIHHYQKNSHHPEHYENGIADMSLMDLIEMLCDWKAAGERHSNGCIERSLQVNRERYNIPGELAGILENTCRELGWIKP